MKLSRILSVALVAVGIALGAVSCTSKEDATIAKLNDLVEKVEKTESIKDIDWDELNSDLAEIQEEAKGCKFTQEQQAKFFELSGKLQGVIIKQGVNGLTNVMKNLGKAAEGMVKGMSEGLEGLDESVDNMANELESSMDDLENALEE